MSDTNKTADGAANHTMPQTKEIEIETPQGKRTVEIRKLNALEGWDLKRYTVDFAKSDDRTFRTSYTVHVLSFASINGRALDNAATVNELLGEWPNVKLVINEVLVFNDIDLECREEVVKAWDGVGARLAITFLMEAEKLIGPTLALLDKKEGEKAE